MTVQRDNSAVNTKPDLIVQRDKNGRNTHTQIPNWVFDSGMCEIVGPTAMWVYMVRARCEMEETKTCHYSQAAIAEKAGLSRQTVNKADQILYRYGLIDRDGKYRPASFKKGAKAITTTIVRDPESHVSTRADTWKEPTKDKSHVSTSVDTMCQPALTTPCVNRHGQPVSTTVDTYNTKQDLNNTNHNTTEAVAESSGPGGEGGGDSININQGEGATWYSKPNQQLGHSTKDEIIDHLIRKFKWRCPNAQFSRDDIGELIVSHKTHHVESAIETCDHKTVSFKAVTHRLKAMGFPGDVKPDYSRGAG